MLWVVISAHVTFSPSFPLQNIIVISPAVFQWEALAPSPEVAAQVLSCQGVEGAQGWYEVCPPRLWAAPSTQHCLMSWGKSECNKQGSGLGRHVAHTLVLVTLLLTWLNHRWKSPLGPLMPSGEPQGPFKLWKTLSKWRMLTGKLWKGPLLPFPCHSPFCPCLDCFFVVLAPCLQNFSSPSSLQSHSLSFR